MHQAKIKQRSLHYAYIDYQKAFDSVPHSWLIKILEIYKINPELITFLEKIMGKWNTTLNIQTDKDTITTKQSNKKRNISWGLTECFLVLFSPKSTIQHAK